MMNRMVNKEFAQEIAAVIRTAQNGDRLPELLKHYHQRDVAKAVTLLTDAERERLFRQLDARTLAEIFPYLDDASRFLAELPADLAAAVITDMDTADALDMLRELPAEKKQTLAAHLDDDTRKDVRRLLAFHQEEIGSRMSGNFVCIPDTLTVCGAMNELVRQALCYAVDKQQIIDLAFDGYGSPIGSSMYPAFQKYFVEDLTDYYPYDPERARELLAEAGYPDGFSMTITVPSNYTPHMNVAQVLVEQLAQVGITATIKPVEWETWLSETYMGRDFESTVVGFDAATLSAGALLNRWMSDNENNMINYDNPEYDAIMEKANTTTDDAEQTKLYKQAAKLLTETAANVYIQDLADFVLIKSDLDGYQFYPLYVMDLSTVHYVQSV